MLGYFKAFGSLYKYTREIIFEKNSVRTTDLIRF